MAEEHIFDRLRHRNIIRTLLIGNPALLTCLHYFRIKFTVRTSELLFQTFRVFRFLFCPRGEGGEDFLTTSETNTNCRTTHNHRTTASSAAYVIVLRRCELQPHGESERERERERERVSEWTQPFSNLLSLNFTISTFLKIYSILSFVVPHTLPLSPSLSLSYSLSLPPTWAFEIGTSLLHIYFASFVSITSLPLAFSPIQRRYCQVLDNFFFFCFNRRPPRPLLHTLGLGVCR